MMNRAKAAVGVSVQIQSDMESVDGHTGQVVQSDMESVDGHTGQVVAGQITSCVEFLRELAKLAPAWQHSH
jgi:hypothetical protein